MKNYCTQDGCHNCLNRFVLTDYDQEAEYYCTKNAPERPLCGNSDERFPERDNLELYEKTGNINDVTVTKEFIEAEKAWKEWSEGRQVQAYGKCDDFNQDFSRYSSTNLNPVYDPI
jgi:hypothetical protein